MTIPKALEGILVSTPDTLHGAVRFVDTRVPVDLFLNTIAAGWSLDRTLKSLPTIAREHALALMEWQNQNTQSHIYQDMLN